MIAIARRWHAAVLRLEGGGDMDDSEVRAVELVLLAIGVVGVVAATIAGPRWVVAVLAMVGFGATYASGYVAHITRVVVERLEIALTEEEQEHARAGLCLVSTGDAFCPRPAEDGFVYCAEHNQECRDDQESPLTWDSVVGGRPMAVPG